MQDKNLAAVKTIENAARRLHDLAIAGLAEFLRPTAAVRVVGQLPDMVEDAFDQLGGRNRIFQGDVIGNGIQIRQRRLRPDYFSHLARRFLAWACVAVRPSATASSPRAMPSRMAMRCCISW